MVSQARYPVAPNCDNPRTDIPSVVTGSSGSSASSSGSLREGQALSADVPGLASALARLLCTLLPVLQVKTEVIGILRSDTRVMIVFS